MYSLLTRWFYMNARTLTQALTILSIASAHAAYAEAPAKLLDDPLTAQALARKPVSHAAPTLTLDNAAATEVAAPAPSGLKLFPDADTKGPPLPFHTIEGYGGGAITPIAYLVNNPGKNVVFGRPSVAASYVNAGSKDLEALTFTETLFGRVELGFGADRLGIGSLRNAIKKATTVDIEKNDVYLYNFNARYAVVDEGDFGISWLPAATVGAHYKYNPDIADINRSLGGALRTIGYHKSSGEDFTLTFSKMFPKSLFDRPLIVSAGLRESQAADLGLLGFGHDWSLTLEGNIVYLPTDWLVLAYEFRQKDDPYGNITGLIGHEDNWHAFDASWIINKNATLVLGYGAFGTLANSQADNAFWVQFKYEF
jgi:hypothetical protein